MPSPFLPWSPSTWVPSSFLSQVLIGLLARLLRRSTTRLLAPWTRVPTSPARGGRCSSSGTKPTTSLWVCTQGPPTPSPSRPAQPRASGPPSPRGSPPKSQVSLPESGCCFASPHASFSWEWRKARASCHRVVLEIKAMLPLLCYLCSLTKKTQSTRFLMCKSYTH